MPSFKINLKDAVDNEVIEPAELATYLKGKIKVDDKVENLAAGGVRVESTDNTVTVFYAKALSKRYLKYLTRRFLHSIKMRDYLRIIADGKNSYAVKLIKVGGDEEEEEEDMDEMD
mmetsp:Transcript_91831/g.137540  ORF Transcript_91831/g.137540 Transcript_91831/m.137540 type:complete len:116 (+) Transcript_91831:31-378(+)|eukprot:CAMPEP_0117045570 /NCGR_PEP_ID=MMETSP0472-20121206/31529_1 /TAXON_ID=693140 ORGANISM="Tiarina fusus, Strain LIS" /NCGR_SAMPLE_ID=MMETSP0472 /ASSEMBLY_ACC=CAM_ASM_000603 /LENGTH=115 /DNA_ID=CAMNT_0004757629 /DNA_START=31 /DNA_END=378 /DNA_ORIENTATION=+